MRMRRQGLIIVLSILGFESSLVLARGNQPSNYSDQIPTGTTDSQGVPQRQGGTITDRSGNVTHAATPAGTDPSITPANRSPYNDRNYREGTPGTSVAGQSQTISDPRQGGNRSTLGTAAPAETGVTPGLSVPSGITSNAGAGQSASPSGNPGPTGNMQTPTPAPTSGGMGTSGSGVGGAPGSISDSGTRGINGSGH